jgi:hypothetical protein
MGNLTWTREKEEPAGCCSGRFYRSRFTVVIDDCWVKALPRERIRLSGGSDQCGACAEEIEDENDLGENDSLPLLFATASPLRIKPLTRSPEKRLGSGPAH